MPLCIGFVVSTRFFVNKAAPSLGEQIRTDLVSVSQIPTDNPEAALRFCRALAGQMSIASLTIFDDQDRKYGSMKFGLVAENASSPELTVVVPIYNEEENLPTLYDRLVSVLEGAKIEFEILFVDDGSNDESPQMLNNLEASDNRIQVIGLARNFGHQIAITAGLDFARGRAVAVMDADLQDPPEVLPDFIAKWREGNEVVYAVRAQRKEGWFKKTSYAAFYRLLRHVSSIDIPLDAGDFCVMDRRVVNLLKTMPERNRFIRGIRSWVGLRQVGVPFERQLRHAGSSKYTIQRLMLLALDGLISFSYVPLRIITLLGLSVSLLSLIMAAFFFTKKLLYGLNPPGYASIIVSIFFLAGIQLITLGVIGEYVGRIFEEAKRRPLYILRRMTGRQ
jgi:polyisoprenyl-phosphate glycosyltransferase